mgnify:CR=1 FL=1
MFKKNKRGSPVLSIYTKFSKEKKNFFKKLKKVLMREINNIISLI